MIPDLTGLDKRVSDDMTPYHRHERQPLPEGRTWISDHREKELRAALRELPELTTLVESAIPGEKLDDHGVRGVPGSRPPLNLDAVNLTRRVARPDLDFTRRAKVAGVIRSEDPIADAYDAKHATDARRLATDDPDCAPRAGRRAGILDTLASWVRLTEGEMCDEGRRQPKPLNNPCTVDGECAWLSGEIVWILDQQWVREFADDIIGLTRECKTLLRIRAPFRPICPTCGRRMHDEQARFCCPGCGRTDSSSVMGLRTVVAQQQPMTAAELHDAFGIPPGTIWRWVHEGHLEPALDKDGQPLKVGKAFKYHLMDALRLRDSGASAC